MLSLIYSAERCLNPLTFLICLSSRQQQPCPILYVFRLGKFVMFWKHYIKTCHHIHHNGLWSWWRSLYHWNHSENVLRKTAVKLRMMDGLHSAELLSTRTNATNMTSFNDNIISSTSSIIDICWKARCHEATDFLPTNWADVEKVNQKRAASSKLPVQNQNNFLWTGKCWHTNLKHYEWIFVPCKDYIWFVWFWNIWKRQNFTQLNLPKVTISQNALVSLRKLIQETLTICCELK